jgi:hypothetical protein
MPQCHSYPEQLQQAAPFSGQVSGHVSTETEFSVIINVLRKLQALKALGASDSELEENITTVGMELAKIVSGICNHPAPSVAASVVSETYTRDTRKVIPESFVPKVVTGPETLRAPGHTSAKPPLLPSGPPLAPSSKFQSEQSIKAPSIELIDSRRSAATNVDKPQVTQPSPRKRPLSFEIDVSKLGPEFKEYGFPWLYDVEDQSTNVDKFVTSNAPPIQAMSSLAHTEASLKVAATRDLIARYFSDLSGHLSYLAPSAQVGLVYKGVKYQEPKMMLDWGSNVCLVDDQWCIDRGIPISRTEMRLTLASSSVGLIGTTPVLSLSYGPPGQEFIT